MKWYEIRPADAVDINCLQHPELDPPLTQLGEICPWPWEPEQLKGVPLGQYHCNYCGEMVLAGIQHFDYRDEIPLN